MAEQQPLVDTEILGCVDCARLLDHDHALTCPLRARGIRTVRREHCTVRGWTRPDPAPTAEAPTLF